MSLLHFHITWCWSCRHEHLLLWPVNDFLCCHPLLFEKWFIILLFIRFGRCSDGCWHHTDRNVPRFLCSQRRNDHRAQPRLCQLCILQKWQRCPCPNVWWWVVLGWYKSQAKLHSTVARSLIRKEIKWSSSRCPHFGRRQTMNSLSLLAAECERTGFRGIESASHQSSNQSRSYQYYSSQHDSCLFSFICLKMFKNLSNAEEYIGLPRMNCELWWVFEFQPNVVVLNN